MVAICGRALSHQRQSIVERAYGNAFESLGERHDWLDAILNVRIECLSRKAQTLSDYADAVLLFSNMMAQATVLSLYNTICLMRQTCHGDEGFNHAYESKARAAALHIVALAQETEQSTYFRVSFLFGPRPHLCIELMLARFILLLQFLYTCVPSSSKLTVQTKALKWSYKESSIP